LSKNVFSLIHGSKQAKKPGNRSNRHRPKIASKARQSRISKNFTYSKRDATEKMMAIISTGMNQAGSSIRLQGEKKSAFRKTLEKQISQAKLAKIMEVDKTKLSLILSGKRKSDFSFLKPAYKKL
jgi:hypothetical protein